MGRTFFPVKCHPAVHLNRLQPCIAGALTMCDDDEGPCPTCKATVRLGDLAPISEGAGFEPAASDGDNKSEERVLLGCSYTLWSLYELFILRQVTGWGVVSVGLGG